MGSRDDLKSSPPSIFVASGLDSKHSTSSGVNFYGENDDENRTMTSRPQHNAGTNVSSSIQYHMLDANNANNNSNNKSSHKYTSPADEAGDSQLDDQTNTTNTSESDDVTTMTSTSGRIHQQSGRFQRNPRSDVSPSQRDSGVAVSESTLEKQFIQARLIKTSNASPKQSTPNLDPNRRAAGGGGKNFVPFASSYDKLMNTTLTTDTDDDQDANSKRLLTHKVNTSSSFDPRRLQQQQSSSSFKPVIYEPSPQVRNDLQSGSMLSNATTNMTSVTPLANVSLLNAPGPSSVGGGGGGIPYSSSDYENLSNTALNDILDNYPRSRAPIVADRKRPPPTAAPPPPRPFMPAPPAPPPSRPPPIYAQSNNDDDEESLVSCQLITSASLLMNRDLVKEARHITAQPKNTSVLPNPRSMSGISAASGTGEANSIRKPAQDAVVQVQTDVDATKPPPMETAI